jgi:hypothetical protein
MVPDEENQHIIEQTQTDINNTNTHFLTKQSRNNTSNN